MENWKGKIALVTGASTGIGAAVAKKLVENEMKVVGCARNLTMLQELTEKTNKNGEGELFPYKCNMRRENEILGMFQFIKKKFGTIHVCVNNAGLAYDTRLLSGETNEWSEMFDVNVIALCIATRESVSLMRSSGVDDGHIINISSIAAHRVTSKYAIYSATKYAVKALTEGLRQELREAKSHIRSTEISPGLVDTDFTLRKFRGDTGKAEAQLSALKCLQADDIADAVLFVLRSPAHMDVNDVIVRPVEQQP